MSTGALIVPFKGVLPRIAADAFVAPTAVVIGDVEIGPGSSIWYGCVLRGDVAPIRIGRGSNIQDGTVIHVHGGGQGTFVGDGITVGHQALLHACRLEHGAFVGMQACVMDGAVVEGGAMVAAGALVTPGKRVPAGQLWTGRPARYLRDLKDEERANIPESAAHYVELAVDYLRQLRAS